MDQFSTLKRYYNHFLLEFLEGIFINDWLVIDPVVSFFEKVIPVLKVFRFWDYLLGLYVESEAFIEFLHEVLYVI